MDNQTCLFIWYFDKLNHHNIPCKEVAQYVVFNGKEDLKAKKKKNRSLEELSFYRLLGMPHSKATIINEVPGWLSLLFSHFLLLIFTPLYSLHLFSLPIEKIFLILFFSISWGISLNSQVSMLISHTKLHSCRYKFSKFLILISWLTF